MTSEEPSESLKETKRVRSIWDKKASGYDKEMAFFERILFPGARQWACSQAESKVLEIAVGTGRNLPYYPNGVDLTGIEYAPLMLGLAKERAAELGVKADLRLGDAQALDLPTTHSTRSSARCLCAPSRMTGQRSARSPACSDLVGA